MSPCDRAKVPQQAAQADAICARLFSLTGNNADPCAKGLNGDRASGAFGLKTVAAVRGSRMTLGGKGAVLAAHY